MTLLISPKLRAEGGEKFVEKVEKIVASAGGKIGKLTEMGKKQLAFPIDKLADAEFLSWSLELPARAVVQLNQKLTVDREIIRHLLVKSEG